MMRKVWAMMVIGIAYGVSYAFYSRDNLDLLIFNLWIIGAYIVDGIITNKPSK